MCRHTWDLLQNHFTNFRALEGQPPVTNQPYWCDVFGGDEKSPPLPLSTRRNLPTPQVIAAHAAQKILVASPATEIKCHGSISGEFVPSPPIPRDPITERLEDD